MQQLLHVGGDLDDADAYVFVAVDDEDGTIVTTTDMQIPIDHCGHSTVKSGACVNGTHSCEISFWSLDIVECCDDLWGGQEWDKSWGKRREAEEGPELVPGKPSCLGCKPLHLKGF